MHTCIYLPVLLQIPDLLSEFFKACQGLSLSQLYSNQLLLQADHISLIWKSCVPLQQV